AREPVNSPRRRVLSLLAEPMGRDHEIHERHEIEQAGALHPFVYFVSFVVINRCSSMSRFAAVMAFGLLPVVLVAEETAVDSTAVRAAVQRSLPLLQQGAKTFRERSEGRCIACHH